jgi:hypothetical protein
MNVKKLSDELSVSRRLLPRFENARHRFSFSAGAVSTDEKTIAAQSAPLGTAMAPSATWAANKGFIGDGAVVSYLNNNGDQP